MGTFSKSYNKKDFLLFLKDNKVSDSAIEKFNNFPETIKANDSEYKLNIVSTFYSTGKTFYNFELNYYSTKRIEFLFKYEIKNDVVASINLLDIEINKHNNPVS
jgi:hypothetical protein